MVRFEVTVATLGNIREERLIKTCNNNTGKNFTVLVKGNFRECIEQKLKFVLSKIG